jgi:hypothetical protein
MTPGQPLQFVITTHRRLAGARLSLRGSWGNQPHSSVETARQAARDHAAGQPMAITTEAHR